VSTPEQKKALAADRARRYRERHAGELAVKEKERRPQRNDYINGYRRERRLMKPFVGVDGEGRNLDNGYHAYFMLRAGGQVLWNRPFDKRLRTNDCLEFLSQLDPDNEYVSYFFDYDVCKILEDLTWSKLDNLVHREKRKRHKGGYFPIDWGPYKIEYFPHKEFKVRKDDGPWVTISDTGTFFQCPFITTLNQWEIGTAEQREQIAAGKELRGQFATVSNAYIDIYNEMECELLADLMTQFRQVCIDLGYIPRKWQGPGQLAEVMLAQHGIPKSRDLPVFATDPETVDQAFREIIDTEYGVGAFGRYCYYGGWFEVTAVGYTPAPCVEWDLNAAYPAAMLHLPCLVHGTWERVTGRRELHPDELSMCFGTFAWEAGSKRTMLAGFPVRRVNGSVHHPLNGKGWYWSFEARSAKHQKFTSYDSWIYRKHCDCQPFGFVKGLYAERKRLGKTAKGMVLKLIMNSLYGKMVQSIGNPTFANPIHGSFLTAWVRSAMSDAIHALPACCHPDPRVPCGSDVFMVATDAIVTVDYLELDRFYDVGDGLGQFGKTVHDNGLFIVQPGVYFDPEKDADDGAKFKTRGVPRRKVIEYRHEFLHAFRRMCESRDVSQGSVHLPYTLFLGIKQSLLRRNMKEMGSFHDYKDPETGEVGRRTSFEWSSKRRPEPLPGGELRPDGTPYRIGTLPYWGRQDHDLRDVPRGMLVQTVPYSKDIGALMRNAVHRTAFEGQPDWLAEPMEEAE
jgi:hypothetical protein